MKRKLLGASMVAAMLLAASSASAAGINIAWNNCLGEGGQANRNFACTSNQGSNILVCSFILDSQLPDVSGIEPVVDVLSNVDPIPPWWEFREAGTCRTASLSANAVANPTNVICLDWAAGQAGGGLAYYGPELGSIAPALETRHRRIKAAFAVPSNALQILEPATEYFSINFVINNAKTVGTGSCGGCLEPLCIVFNSLNVTTPLPENNVKLGSGATPGSNFATWQGTGPDCQLVPVRNRTWGAVKSLYR